MRKLNFINKVFFAVLMSSVFFSCGSNLKNKKLSNDIIVLYTNDVHCSVDSNIGYAGLAAYKNECLEKTPFVTTVDNGDAIQGEIIGDISKGSYIVDIMNAVGYDFAIFGNHEFDYGINTLSDLIDKSNAKYLCTNITYSGSGKSFLEKASPYEIVQYDDVKVAYIGVSTPYSIKSSTPAYFKEGNQFVYNFGTDGNGKEFYKRVQKSVNDAKKKGADFVILLSHLGIEEEPGCESYTVYNLIKNTDGIDAVLDAHSHSVVPVEQVKNKKGEDVILSQTGSRFSSFGKLTINTDKQLSTELVYKYEKKDPAVDQVISGIRKEINEELSKVVAQSDVYLDINSAHKTRLIRNREIPLGNLVADSIAYVMNTDIAFMNGGGIRRSLTDGKVTYGDVFGVLPFGNFLCTAEVTGQQIADALEFSVKNVSAQTDDGRNAVGEFGGWLQVSGLHFEVDTSIPSPVVLDELGMFAGVEGKRRVQNIEILNYGIYEALDLNAVYKVASIQYIISENGDGYTMFKDAQNVMPASIVEHEAVVRYIKEYLKGNLKKRYSKPEGRIVIK